jgi:hypothetical protein
MAKWLGKRVEWVITQYELALWSQYISRIDPSIVAKF